MPTGYSKRPLAKKLGIKEGAKVRLINPPEDYFDLLGELPEIEYLEDNTQLVDFIHLFSKSAEHFGNQFLKLKDEIEKSGMIWVSWYKKASNIQTDLNENIIRNTALSLGLVDVKVCAVDEKWSALKIVWRKENRYSTLLKRYAGIKIHKEVSFLCCKT
jgi:hypothetical protein